MKVPAFAPSMNSRHQLLGPLAEGGLGTVFRARDLQSGNVVAIKRVRRGMESTAAADALLQEARLQALCHHPNIVAVLDSGVDEEGGFMAMELVEGETLEEAVTRGAFDHAEFGALVCQTLAGVAAVHEKGVLHLDLKPQNLMLHPLEGGGFEVKILDFGLARPLGQQPAQDGTPKLLGSVHFMAPEQFEKGGVDERTDLYALGCVFYHALTQQPPFGGELAPQVMVSHLYHRSASLAVLRPDLPAAVVQWVEWLISRAPAERPASAKEALHAYHTATGQAQN